MVRSGGLSGASTIITYIRGLIAPLITTHEPPSRGQDFGLSRSQGPGLRFQV